MTWTEAELSTLRELFPTMGYRNMAKVLGMPVNEVRNKIVALGMERESLNKNRRPDRGAHWLVGGKCPKPCHKYCQGCDADKGGHHWQEIDPVKQVLGPWRCKGCGMEETAEAVLLIGKEAEDA